MSGGMDILIVGIAGKDVDDQLESIAPPDTLRKLFGGNFLDDFMADKHYEYAHRLENDPATMQPGLFYISGENLWGAAVGTGLGYVLFSGNNNAPPTLLDELIFARIPELKELFLKAVQSHGLEIGNYVVGVHALNVCDT